MHPPVSYSLDSIRTLLDSSAISAELLETYQDMLQDALAILKSRITAAEPCPGSSTEIRCLEAANRPAQADAVCQILHTDATGARRPIGTGTFIKRDNLVLTAGHVIPLAIEMGLPNAGSLLARFGHEQECDGEPTVAAWRDFSLSLIASEFKRGGLDYALLRATSSTGVLPGDLYAPLPIGASGGLIAGDPLTCVHHPRGLAKQVSSGLCEGHAGSLLAYRLFTQSQSSGAPLISAGRAVAVHAMPSRVDPCLKLGVSMDAILATSAVL